MNKINIGGKEIPLPKTRPMRILVGVVLILLGFVGFLPVIGFWMIPLGILVLSVDVPFIRRGRLRFVAWNARRKQRKAGQKAKK